MSINTMNTSIAVNAHRHIYPPNDTPPLRQENQLKMLQIEWKSAMYHSDGRPRSRPKASTVHGWLVKWRATFSGNERLRKEGMREMREAKAVREWKKERRAARRAKAGSKSPCRLWPISLDEAAARKKKRRTHALQSKALPRIPQAQAPSPSPKRLTREGSQRLPITSPPHSPRHTPTNSRRSSHNRQETPQSSRRASRDSRRDALRAVDTPTRRR